MVKIKNLCAWLLPKVFFIFEEKHCDLNVMLFWGERWDLHPRMLGPQSSAIATTPRPPKNPVLKIGINKLY